ncbi:PA0069 family radical SAM protein [Rhodobacterales bacterium HKCCE3408]|nr:PA0069 family radical SAM protein [Rhodobacterales bacterium HKCCE3408]
MPAPPDSIDDARRRARGAATNRTNRFERFVHEAEDDGWGLPEDLPPIRTEVAEERARTIITRNTSPDVPFDRSINPYRGCEHGCVYCFARPSHAFLGYSPGLDFETRLIARPNAAALLEAELRKASYTPEVIAIGTNTDPYQPVERDRRIMRQVLEVLQAFRHPVGIATKGTLVERDADILSEMGQAGLARVGLSVTTLDPALARKMEPRVPSPARRLAAIETLAKAGVEVRVMVSPIVPGLTDHEIETILASARDAGAVAASMISLRLPREVADLWRDWLQEHYPERFNRVMTKVREMHGGQDYDPSWGRRMTGEGIFARLMQDRFARATKATGLATRLPPLRTDLFRPPPRAGDQLSLF